MKTNKKTGILLITMIIIGVYIQGCATTGKAFEFITGEDHWISNLLDVLDPIGIQIILNEDDEPAATIDSISEWAGVYGLPEYKQDTDDYAQYTAPALGDRIYFSSYDGVSDQYTNSIVQAADDAAEPGLGMRTWIYYAGTRVDGTIIKIFELDHDDNPATPSKINLAVTADTDTALQNTMEILSDIQDSGGAWSPDFDFDCVVVQGSLASYTVNECEPLPDCPDEDGDTYIECNPDGTRRELCYAAGDTTDCDCADDISGDDPICSTPDCSLPLYAECAFCQKPGMDEVCGDLIDNDCDSQCSTGTCSVSSLDCTTLDGCGAGDTCVFAHCTEDADCGAGNTCIAIDEPDCVITIETNTIRGNIIATSDATAVTVIGPDEFIGADLKSKKDKRIAINVNGKLRIKKTLIAPDIPTVQNPSSQFCTDLGAKDILWSVGGPCANPLSDLVYGDQTDCACEFDADTAQTRVSEESICGGTKKVIVVAGNEYQDTRLLGNLIVYNDDPAFNTPHAYPGETDLTATLDTCTIGNPCWQFLLYELMTPGWMWVDANDVWIEEIEPDPACAPLPDCDDPVASGGLGGTICVTEQTCSGGTYQDSSDAGSGANALCCVGGSCAYQTCSALGGTGCNPSETCLGGTFSDSSDEGTGANALCCVGGSCTASLADCDDPVASGGLGGTGCAANQACQGGTFQDSSDFGTGINARCCVDTGSETCIAQRVTRAFPTAFTQGTTGTYELILDIDRASVDAEFPPPGSVSAVSINEFIPAGWTFDSGGAPPVFTPDVGLGIAVVAAEVDHTSHAMCDGACKEVVISISDAIMSSFKSGTITVTVTPTVTTGNFYGLWNFGSTTGDIGVGGAITPTVS